MIKVNFVSALISSHIAAHHLEKNGLLVLTGAQFPYFNIDPSMLTYSLSKNLVHNLHLNLARSPQYEDKNFLTILPTIIDTPANRKAMP